MQRAVAVRGLGRAAITRRGWFTLLVALLLWAWPLQAWAHPDHVALAEMRYNADLQVFEVALRCKPEDLERALSLRAARRLTLEDAEVATQLPAYLQATFRVQVRQRVVPLRWVGHEVTARFVWLYFEVPVRASALRRSGALTLAFDFLFDVEEEQANTASLRVHDELMALRFRVGEAGPKAIEVPSQRQH